MSDGTLDETTCLLQSTSAHQQVPFADSFNTSSITDWPPNHHNNADLRLMFSVSGTRPAYTHHDANAVFSLPTSSQTSSMTTRENPSNCRRDWKRCAAKCCTVLPPSGECLNKAVSVLLSLFPFVAIMKKYSVRYDLLSDVMAGLIVGIMSIPQGKSSSLIIYAH